MKTFSQFLEKSYITEEEARQGSLFTRKGTPQDFTNPKKTPFTATDPTPTPASRRLPAGSSEAPKTSPGQMEIDFNAKPNKGGALATRPTSTPSAPIGSRSNPQRIYTTPVKPSTQKPSLPSAGQTGKPPAGLKPTGKWAKIGKFAGPAAAAVDTAFSTADERDKGSGWLRSLAKGATVAAGGLAGGTLGAIGGGGIGSAALGTAGAIGGAELAGKAFDVVAGANARERAAMAQANRRRQEGGGIKGIGGKTTFSQTKPGGPAFMSTGVGKQRRTVQLGKTSVVTDPTTGNQEVGYLAFKDGKPVYKRAADPKTLRKTSSNPLERIGRTLFKGAYKEHDAAQKQKALKKARQSDVITQQKLGVKAKPGG